MQNRPPNCPKDLRNPRQTLGLEGEERAADYLESKGYRIVARNVRADRVEIDLVARKGPLLVFVEVKTRRGTSHGLAAEAVDERKQRRLRRGAWAWLETDPAAARGTRQRRFDVVTCVRRNPPAAPSALRSPPSPASPASQLQNETAAPSRVRRLIDSSGLQDRWSIEHWKAAF
ncbi:MAG: YraN family protein [Myxococcota bacterium]